MPGIRVEYMLHVDPAAAVVGIGHRLVVVVLLLVVAVVGCCRRIDVPRGRRRSSSAACGREANAVRTAPHVVVFVLAWSHAGGCICWQPCSRVESAHLGLVVVVVEARWGCCSVLL